MYYFKDTMLKILWKFGESHTINSNEVLKDVYIFSTILAYVKTKAFIQYCITEKVLSVSPLFFICFFFYWITEFLQFQ